MSAKGHLHFLGIFGHAMRGVAAAAKELGYTVSGTDDGAYPPAGWLDERGITWWQEPDAAHLKGVTEVIVSGHVLPDHPELAAAREQGIPVRSFPELVGELTAAARRIVVAGTHGKTTTTSLIAWLLESAGRQPDFLVGIKPRNFDSSVRLAGGSVAVLEGDEYRASQLDTTSKFSYYRPDVLALTSIEMDHPDFFKDLDDIAGRFAEFVGTLPPDGHLYYWQGSPAVRRVAEAAAAPKAPYDLADAEWSARSVEYRPDGLAFELVHHDEVLAAVTVPLYGSHNVLNAIAASAVALGEGITVQELTDGLRTFQGAARRFERVSPEGGQFMVIDDYAHHPSEVAATLKAAKLHFPGRVIAVFRPHTYSRTEKLLKEYGTAFDDADAAFIAEIEGARESSGKHRVSAAGVAAEAGDHVRHEADRGALLDAVAAAAEPGDTILCMTVSGYQDFAQELSERLNQ